MRTRSTIILAVLAAGGGLLAMAQDGPRPSGAEVTSRPVASAPARPVSNLEAWLALSQPAEARPADTQPATAANPFATAGNFRREDALPGVVRLSNGQVLAGGLCTTRDRDWLVWVEAEKRWRPVPFLAVLSITAVVVEDKMEEVWRWKEMGVPERVYTGEQYPTRRLLWTFRLLDGSSLTGAVKGQPLWVLNDSNSAGPFVLHEQVRGEAGQGLKDLLTVQKVIVSRRLMDKLLAAPSTAPADR